MLAIVNNPVQNGSLNMLMGLSLLPKSHKQSKNENSLQHLKPMKVSTDFRTHHTNKYMTEVIQSQRNP